MHWAGPLPVRNRPANAVHSSGVNAAGIVRAKDTCVNLGSFFCNSGGNRMPVTDGIALSAVQRHFICNPRETSMPA